MDVILLTVNPEHMIYDQRACAFLPWRNRVQMVRMFVRWRPEGRLRQTRAWAAGSVYISGYRRRRRARDVGDVLVLCIGSRPVMWG